VIVDAHTRGCSSTSLHSATRASIWPNDYEGDPEAEYLKFFRLGADGVFTDFSSTSVSARTAYAKGLGRTAP
jgi:glycerophosphoryl diester phosphodiesterase